MALPIATKGHAEKHGGLRGHSIGDVYPYSVVGVGHAPTLWGALDTRNGEVGTLWPSVDEAYTDCKLFKLFEVFRENS